jgi:hypothetical protein
VSSHFCEIKCYKALSRLHHVYFNNQKTSGYPGNPPASRLPATKVTTSAYIYKFALTKIKKFCQVGGCILELVNFHTHLMLKWPHITRSTCIASCYDCLVSYYVVNSLDFKSINYKKKKLKQFFYQVEILQIFFLDTSYFEKGVKEI